MNHDIHPKTFDSLQRLAVAGDLATFARLVETIVAEAVRTEIARRAIAERERREGPFSWDRQ